MSQPLKTVLVFGTFDKLHAGHRFFLETAKTHGDRLVVVVARDHNVQALKGHWPHDHEAERLAKVKAEPAVTEARLGYADFSQKEKIIFDIRPDCICLGYDQAPNFQSPLAGVEVIRLPSYHPEKYKSSLL